LRCTIRRTKHLAHLVAACALTAAWTATPREASAASVQRVQSGTAVNSANGTQTITISPVDPAKSFLVFESRHDSARPVGSSVRGRLASSTTIEFLRVTDGVSPEPAPIDIQWYVVTFGAGVRVQRGEVAQASTTVNVAISAVASLSQAFVLWSKTPVAADNEWGSDDQVLGELTSTTNLQFRADAANAGHIIAWQVVEFTTAADINVQTGSIATMTGTTTSVTGTLSPAVDPGKTFVLVGWRTSGGGADIGARMLRARITDSTTVTVDRDISGSPDDITEIVWQAVELRDGSLVQGGTTNLATGVSTATVQLGVPVNATRSVTFGSAQSGSGQNAGRSPYAGDDVTGVGAFATDLGIGLRGAASASAGSGVLTLTVNKPAGTVEYDVMLASIAFRPHTAVITPPTGWTLVRRTDNATGSTNSLAVYWKAADDVEPASYNWTFNTSTGTAGGILTLIDVDNANPIDVENGQTTPNSLSHAAPSVTTTRGDTMVVSVHGFSSSATWTPPAGMTEVVDIASETVPNCCGIALEVNYALQSAAGPTGILTATASGDTDTGNTQTLALRPANSARYLRLRRNNTADTADLGWFVVQFDQGPGFKVGSFTKSTGAAPASQVIAHGLGSTPKAIIFWTDGQTNETFNAASYLYGFGMTDGATSKSVAAASLTGANTSNASTRMANKALTLVQWSEALVAEADLQSWDDTNFTLNWTTNNATAYIVHYIVIGGTDVSARVVEWTMGTATGNRVVTGVGFQPSAVIHAHGTHTFTAALPSSIAGAGFGLGAMDADGDQWATTFFTVDNSGNADTQRGQQTDGAIYAFNAGLTVQKKASWVSMNADGFTVNFTNAASAAAARVLSLALKGVNVKPGSFLKSTGAAPASQTVTGVGFRPSAVLLSSFQDITRAAPVAHSRWGIGASDGTTEASSAMTDENGVGTTSVRAVDKTSKAFIVADNSTSTINAEANLTGLNSDGFTLNWTTNNATQTQVLYLALAPMSLTEVRLLTLTAARYDRGVLVQWRTGYEIDNLGFHVYREVDGTRTRVTTALVAGSGLALGRGVPANGERNYAFWDLSGGPVDPGAVYWLQDVDFNGQTTWHGPVSPVAGGVQVPPVVTSKSLGEGTCREQGTGSASVRCASSDARDRFVSGPGGTASGDLEATLDEKFELRVGESAVIGHTGLAIRFEQVLEDSRCAAGTGCLWEGDAIARFVLSSAEGQATQDLHANLESARERRHGVFTLRLLGVSGPFGGARLVGQEHVASLVVRSHAQDLLRTQWKLAAGGAVRINVTRPGWYYIGQPDLVAAGLGPAVDPRALRLYADGVEQAIGVVGQDDGRLDAVDGVEFFATGVDTPHTDTRVYWLVAGDGPGRRMTVHSRAPAAPPATQGHRHWRQHKERSVYFAALRNGDVENWFGQLVSDYETTEVTIRLSNVDPGASTPAQLELALQGVTVGGEANHQVGVFVNGLEVGEVSFSGQERPVFTLPFPPGTLQEGDNIVGLIARAGEEDFSLIDYINVGYWHTGRADADQLLFTAEGRQPAKIDGFTTPSIRVVDVTDPNSAIEVAGIVSAEGGLYAITIDAPGTGQRRLFAFTDPTVSQPALVQADLPSSWHAAANAFDYVVLARREYFDALAPLAALRETRGHWAAVVDIQDVYDEFGFGGKTPAAIRSFLQRATTAWQRAPRFLVLAGDATMDPRDYGGFGDFDLIPTKLLSMASVALETASDEWFADFDDDGLPELAVGRLPVRTVEQAEVLVAKIVGYETQPVDAWAADVTFVADERDPENDFEQSSRSLVPVLPAGYRAHEVYRGQLGGAAGAELARQVTEGRLVVNYLGHGSTELWGRQGDLLSNDIVRDDWRGGSRLPFVVAMNCLNGFFHGIYGEESLAEALLRTPDGGAVAAWASSSLTSSATQQVVSSELFSLLFKDGTLTLGEAVSRAKAVVGQRDVRRSWIFFGDPATRLLGVLPGARSGDEDDPVPVETTTHDDPAADPAKRGGHLAGGGRRVHLADFDGDGRADVLAYRPDTGEWQIWTATGRALATGSWPVGLEVRAADFDSDGLADLFLYEPLSGGWFTLVNHGAGFLASAGTTLPDSDVRLGNLAGDKGDEVFVYQPATGSWSVGVDDGQGRLVFTTGSWAPDLTVRVADFDGDRRADILTYHSASGSLRIMFADSTGGVAIVDGTTHGGREVLIANLDADRRADLLFHDRTTGRWETWVSPELRRFVVGASGRWTPGLAVQLADVNGDGFDEALLYELHSGRWTVAPLTAAASGLTASGSAPAWATLASGDADGDGLAELYLYQPRTGAVVLINAEPNGAMNVSNATWPSGWTLQGYASGDPLETETLEPVATVPGGPKAADGSRMADPTDRRVADADVRAALRTLGLQMPASAAGASGRNVGREAATAVAAPRGAPAPAARTAGAGRSNASARTSAKASTNVRTNGTARTGADASMNVLARANATARITGDAPAADRDRHDPLQVVEDVAPRGAGVTTAAATSVTAASATLRGSVRRGAGTKVGFLLGTENPPTVQTPLRALDGTSGSFAQPLAGLAADTVYYFQAVVQEAGGHRLLGDVRSFRTPSSVVPDAAEAGDVRGKSASASADVPHARNAAGGPIRNQEPASGQTAR
jgi:hypothetical protein